MKKFLAISVLLFTATVLADDSSPLTELNAEAAKAPQIAKSQVLTVKERLNRIEYIDVTSEKELIEDESTEISVEIEQILAEAEKEDSKS